MLLGTFHTHLVEVECSRLQERFLLFGINEEVAGYGKQAT